ncbi:hypothetical protein OG453_35495 [Streptomyces sp. NBC_01381]|uniref:hypothetical protein n=1 Tax=Streptomyces sp. NBC_01381 TaxID=2903845 RepID=UPI002255334B|nr:hypothetical protein [Streptomyces sp. NBC_01381]MCX4671923.1 hypothetical protein [Streptomyces sp. NBC_01381]
MNGGGPLRVPVGHDADRWTTFRSEKTLVVAARTVTSTARVLECLPALLRGDSRVSVVFAYDGTSAFNDGVLDLLHASGCRVMPWDQLGRITPDLIVSASENIDVPDGACPVLVLPHGIGFQKFVPDSRSARDRLSGVVPDRLLEAGRAWLALSHPAQEEQLVAAHPKAAGRTLLVGDPVYDELRAGAGRAAAYRRALGLRDDQHLVVLSSTWGSTSLLGRTPDLPARLLAALPCDEYRVAAIVHPNIWAAHGSWQIRNVQAAAALEAGLLLVPPVGAWQSVLVAASAVVGDHGSVTLYGAALGKPVLLGAFGHDSVPGTAIAELGRTAPRFDPHGDLYAQLRHALRPPAPGRYAAVADHAFAEPGLALARLRTAVYGLMELPEPRTAPPAPSPPPRPEPAADVVTSWTVTTSVIRDQDPATVVVRRHPAAVGDTAGEEPGTFTHLACDDAERDTRLTESASVLLRRDPAATATEAINWAHDTLDRYPGALLAASTLSGGGCLAALRDGRLVEAAITGPPAAAGLAAAAVYTCLRADLPLTDTIATLRIGDAREEDVALRIRPQATTEPHA